MPYWLLAAMIGLGVTNVKTCPVKLNSAFNADLVFVVGQVKMGSTYRAGTILVSFRRRRRILSTRHGLGKVRAVAIHGAPARAWIQIHRYGFRLYEYRVLRQVLKRLRLGSAEGRLLSTAADPTCLAVVIKSRGWLKVAAIVTAGAGSNAMRAGTDYGDWLEGKRLPRKPPGTINIILLTSCDLTQAAMARLIICVTEAKAAAMQDLGIMSSYTSSVQATGTGTDEVIIVAGRGRRQHMAGGHTKLCELAARAAHQAVLRALIRQMKKHLTIHRGRPPKPLPKKAKCHPMWPRLRCQPCPTVE